MSVQRIHEEREQNSKQNFCIQHVTKRLFNKHISLISWLIRTGKEELIMKEYKRAHFTLTKRKEKKIERKTIKWAGLLFRTPLFMLSFIFFNFIEDGCDDGLYKSFDNLLLFLSKIKSNQEEGPAQANSFLYKTLGRT